LELYQLVMNKIKEIIFDLDNEEGFARIWYPILKLPLFYQCKRRFLEVEHGDAGNILARWVAVQ
jgi:hypothetical protein